MPVLRTIATIGVVLSMTLGACGGSEGLDLEPADGPRSSSDGRGEDVPSSAVDRRQPVPPPPDTAVPAPNPTEAAGVDLGLDRTDIKCSEGGLGEGRDFDFTTAHKVVDGVLGKVCVGEEDPVLVDAWLALAAMTPRDQLADLSLFGGYTSDEGGDFTTLAFVSLLPFSTTHFQMSINLDTARYDDDDLALTMAHELSHVFTGVAGQLDRSREASTSCETYFNGSGCYVPDSLMMAWVDAFWSRTIDEIDPFVPASGDDTLRRCEDDAGFFGPYAATSPEEDFAETFSAFVLRVEPSTPEQQARLDFMHRRPELVAFRDRTEANGLGPIENSFDRCGAPR